MSQFQVTGWGTVGEQKIYQCNLLESQSSRSISAGDVLVSGGSNGDDDMQWRKLTVENGR
ncbi:conserved hypothetical protein [Ricinus communis]|uniref:Uncharacterized protein n=1 Tax=Ricinus communis TaxID=3988 RepID=B9RHW7_RICCO|nr:conserved hypothetical protein [Ricinus communis]